MVTARMGEWKSLSGYVRLASLSLGSVSVPFVTSSFTSSERHEPVPPGRRKERRVTWETWGTVRGRSLSSFTLVRHSPFSSSPRSLRSLCSSVGPSHLRLTVPSARRTRVSSTRLTRCAEAMGVSRSVRCETGRDTVGTKYNISVPVTLCIINIPLPYAEPVASEGGRRETPTDIETRGSAAPHSIRHPSPSHSPRLAGSAAPSGRKRDEGEWEGII